MPPMSSPFFIPLFLEETRNRLMTVHRRFLSTRFRKKRLSWKHLDILNGVLALKRLLPLGQASIFSSAMTKMFIFSGSDPGPGSISALAYIIFDRVARY